MGSNGGVSRRAFEVITLVAIPLAYGAAFVTAVLRFLLPSPSRRLARLEVEAPASKIAAGQVVEVLFNGRLIFVLHDGSRIRALDATCSHFACRVKWWEKERQFRCPCHGGIFAANGDRISGPPPKALREQALQVGDDGRIVLIDDGGRA